MESKRKNEQAPDALPKSDNSSENKGDGKNDLAVANPIGKPQLPPTEPENSQPKNKEHESSEWRKNSIERALFIVECLGIIGLIFYCIINWMEWQTFDSERQTMEREFQTNQTANIAAQNVSMAAQKIAEQQIKEMQLATRLDERAWVGVFHDAIETNGAGGVYFVVDFSNTGKTPAVNVASCIRVWVGGLNVPAKDPYPTNSDVGLYNPGSIGHVATIDKPIYGDFYKSVTSGLPYCVYGTVWYDDIFGSNHWNQFCFRITEQFQCQSMTIHNSCDDAQKSQSN